MVLVLRWFLDDTGMRVPPVMPLSRPDTGTRTTHRLSWPRTSLPAVGPDPCQGRGLVSCGLDGTLIVTERCSRSWDGASNSRCEEHFWRLMCVQDARCWEALSLLAV